MFKIAGIVIEDGVYMESITNCDGDPYIEARDLGVVHGYITKGEENEVIAVIDDNGNIQEV